MFVRQKLRLWAKSISHTWLRLKAGSEKTSRQWSMGGPRVANRMSQGVTQ